MIFAQALPFRALAGKVSGSKTGNATSEDATPIRT